MTAATRNREILLWRNQQTHSPSNNRVQRIPHRVHGNVPSFCTGVAISRISGALFTAVGVGGGCSGCRMNKDRGFSRGTNITSALGVDGASSPSLKKETYKSRTNRMLSLHHTRGSSYKCSKFISNGVHTWFKRNAGESEEV